jgi:hypothetical protein
MLCQLNVLYTSELQNIMNGELARMGPVLETLRGQRETAINVASEARLHVKS